MACLNIHENVQVILKLSLSQQKNIDMVLCMCLGRDIQNKNHEYLYRIIMSKYYVLILLNKYSLY